MQMTNPGKRYGWLVLAVWMLLSWPVWARAPEPVALPGYQADLSQTTVSGLSSGAYMAGQFAVAYSGLVRGVALIAGGPYYCAGSVGQPPYIPYLSNAMSTCMNPGDSGAAPPVAERSWEAARNFARAGTIDDPAHIARQKVYLFSGIQDRTVTRVVVDQARKFYQLAGVPEANVRYIVQYDAGHALVTDRRGDRDCPLTESPYINFCDYAQARDILQYFYPDGKPPATQPGGRLLRFNQRSFIRSAYSSMNNSAYAYVPKSCDRQSCRVHVAFHGCRQGASLIGDHYYARAGFNEVADTNNIIVLYPQVDPSPVYPYNPRGCWDFWGYTSVNPFLPDFFMRNGPQMAAVKAMLDRLGAPRGPAP
ncbi:MAG: poly(3-hydroxybutyrate) depolymerase [Pseudomonadota bacterium]